MLSLYNKWAQNSFTAIFFGLLFAFSALSEREQDIGKIFDCVSSLEPVMGKTKIEGQLGLGNLNDVLIKEMAILCPILFPTSFWKTYSVQREIAQGEFAKEILDDLSSTTKAYDNWHDERKREFTGKVAAIATDSLEDRTDAIQAIVEELSKRNEEEKKAAAVEQLENIVKTSQLAYDNAHIANNISLNLMWINEKVSSTQEYIFPVPYVRQWQSINIFERIKQWAEYYPVVNFWYDSQVISPGSLERTQEKIAKEFETPSKIHFRDIRELKIILNNPDIGNNWSTYFKADLIRIILSYELLSEAQVGTFLIYADLSVTPIGPNELLDNMTTFNLNTYGFVLPQNSPRSRIENNFHIIGNNKPNLLTAIKTAIIDANIRRYNNRSTINFPYGRISFNQFVYNSYLAMYQLFYNLENKADGIACGSQWRDKSPEDLAACFWETFGEQVIPKSPTTVTDPLLQLQREAQQFNPEHIYVPSKIDSRFPKSHFG
jgi:hypothetical protein